MRSFMRLMTFSAFAAFALLRCSGDGNPYLDADASGLRVLSRSFVDGDTVGIFSTESLQLELHIKEHIDHFRLRTRANRLWASTDTVIGADQFSHAPFTFKFSFYDTGWQEISLIAQRTTGDSVEERLRIYARSPLRQEPISGGVGDTVSLATPPVADDVLYIWDFRDGTVIRNNDHRVKHFVKTPLSGGIGELYVSDRIRRSPSVLFTVIPAGRLGMFIRTLNDSIRGDTVFAGDAEFTFRVAVSGAASILTATVNDAPFERALRDSSGAFVLSKTFHGLDSLTGPTNAAVSITDGAGSTAQKTFWILYSRAIPRSDRPVISVIFPPTDSTTTGTRSCTIRGHVGNRRGFDSLALFLSLGDSLRPDYRYLVKDSTWQWTLDLDPGWNRIAVMAFEDTSRQGDTLAAIRRAIAYTPGARDTIPPSIVALLGNGRPIYDGFVTADSLLRVEADILDETGIATVLINGVPVAGEPESSWFRAAVALAHGIGGTAIRVTAIDSSANRADTVVTAYRNRTAIFSHVPPTVRVFADSLYSAMIGVTDPDGDSVSLTVKIHRTRMDTVLVLGAARTVVWQPAPVDTGWRTIDVRAWDGYQAVDTFFTLYVSPNSADAVPVRFLTSQADIPDSLIAADDTLRLDLRIDPVSGTPPLRFTARVKNGPALLENSADNRLIWSPAESDTGVRMLEVVVIDSLGFSDTISALVAVVSPPRISVFFDRTGSSASESVSPRIVGVRLSGPARKIISIACAVDWFRTTADSTDFELPANRVLVFNPGDTARTIALTVVDDTLIEYDERVGLLLTSASSGAVIGSRSAYTCTLVDDDKVSISFTDSTSSASESQSPRTVAVRLTKPADKEVSVRYSVDSATTSASSADYRLDSNRVLTFAPGQTAQEIRVVTVDDSLIENDEILMLRLEGPSSLAVLGGRTTHACRIIDDDTPNQVKVYFTSSGSSGPESVSPARIGLRLSGKSTVPVTVSVEIDPAASTATAPGDYTAPAASTIIFPPGTTDTAVAVAVVNDATIEGDETIVLTLKSPSAYAALGSPTKFTYTITDDDTPARVFIEFLTSNSSAPESSPATAALKLSSPSTVPISISYVVDTVLSTAKAADYQLPSNRVVSFQPGDTVKTITIPIVNDSLAEPDESLVLRLTNPSSYASIGARASHTRMILNNDYILLVNVTPVSSGSVTRTVSGAASQGPYSAGTEVTLQALPAANYAFDKWIGPVLTTATPAIVRVRMDSSVSITAALKLAPPVIVVEPLNEDAPEGQSAYFGVTATGLNLSYQWYKNGVAVPGATTAWYTTPPLTMADHGAKYRCVVSNPGGSVTSRELSIIVYPVAPAITVQPVSQSVKPNATASFSVTATGSLLKYQWQKNTTAISGATAASYTTPPVAESDNGATFRCVVSNSAGSVTSSPATLTVSAMAPTITRQPRDTIVNEGAKASFIITASGTGLSYRWQKNGAAITGATTATYVTPAVLFADSGAVFRCVVTNSGGTATSNGAVLSVRLGPPAIVTQPSNQSVTEGQTATFSVAASGSRVTYQWQKNGFDISGASATSYTTPATLFTDSGSAFRCIVRNSAGSATSSSAILLVALAPPVVVTHPADLTVDEPQSATFSAATKGSKVSLQWQRNGVNISGATGSSYTIPATVAADSGSMFRLSAANGAGTVTTTGAVLRVRRAPPSITSQPSGRQITEGQTATFSITASGSNLVYQWTRNSIAITAATNATYTTPPATIADSNAQFRCTITNPVGSVTSTAAVLTVKRAIPEVTTNPSSITVMEGDPALFSVIASGTGVFYRWQRGTTDIPGAASSTYTIAAAAMADSAARFRCIVSNSSGADTSARATLTVTPRPVLPTVTGPAPQTVTENSSATFSVMVVGGTTPVSYQWQRNSVEISGATAAVYTMPSVPLSQSGEVYRCIVTNAAGSVISAEALLTVTPAPVGPAITVDPVSVTVNEGESALFSVTATGTPPLSYQWRHNGTSLPGATGALYSIPAVTASQDGDRYSCTVTNDIASVTSAEAILTVNAAPVITIQPASQTVTEGGSVQFSVAAIGAPPLSYQWYRNDTTITGAVAATYVIPEVSITSDGDRYRCTVNNTAGNVSSAEAVLTVNPQSGAPIITSHPQPVTTAEGGTASFRVRSDGVRPFTYQWQVVNAAGTFDIGTNDPNFTIPAVQLSQNGEQYHCIVANSLGTVTSESALLTVE